MKEEITGVGYLCLVCQKVKVQTDGYYHSFKANINLTICIGCYEAGVVWAAKQAFKGK